MRYFVIPARQGSKRFENKNRVLFDHIAKVLDWDDPAKVIVTTDDASIINKALERGFQIINRDEKLCQDNSSMKNVLLDVVKKKTLQKNDTIVLLYLTYPERASIDIIEATFFFTVYEAKSLLCKMPVVSHPFLCLYESSNNHGQQIIKHNLYRWQDYPRVFEISHFISIFKVSELKKLNKNLYNENTIYYPIDRKIDVDIPEDYKKFQESR